MIVKIQPSTISGTVNASASKSSMQRACAAALLKEGDTIIGNPGKSNDDLAALDVIQKLGATVKQQGNDLLVSSKGINPVSPEINCGESGLGLRMFAPIASLNPQEIILNGSGSLLQRPMNFFDEIFPLLKIDIQSNNGKLPIKIKGPLKPADITIDGSLSSQFLTGLLMAYAKACTAPVTIRVNDLKSKPYIDLTLQVMKYFGWDVKNSSYKEFYFTPTTNHQLPTTNYIVEGDWSGAAFLLVAGAIAGEIIVEGLDVNSPQADKAILSALKDAGAKMSVEENKIMISPAELKSFDFDATDCPDLFPPLVALAAYCNGTTNIKGVTRLAHKESNRALSLQQEFKKMGVEIEVKGDNMLINGNTRLTGANVHSHHDHRIAMACAVAALKAGGETVISDADAINKSYPDFYDHLQKLNADLQKV
ncbi:MAG: 3-phosphoshikimate 1-carboxyvinyltransferase [Chitinophagaceae bacterium]|nr:3-phosphoshikimate 1-carboxyvinyltransferase [Chitinophagaceae bacterium]MDB5223093.1 3-phosphoshikimate 1-carboxyvinyltransferase [Chitinophagaceae bacterium]